MLIESLCLLALTCQLDPLIYEYSVKVENTKIAFFGLGINELYEFSQNEFVRVNENLYGNSPYSVAVDRPVVIGNKIFVPKIESNSIIEAIVDVLEITGNQSNLIASFSLGTDPAYLKLDKLHDTTIAGCLVRGQNSINIFQIRHTGFGLLYSLFLPNILGTYEQAELHNILVLDRFSSKEIYAIFYLHSPERMVIYNFNTGWKHVEYNFENRKDSVPSGYPLCHKSNFGTLTDWLYIQSHVAMNGEVTPSYIRHFAPGTSTPLIPWNWSTAMNMYSFVGLGDQDFDGDTRNEYVMTGYGYLSEYLIVGQMPPFETYTQVFLLSREYRWVIDAVGGDFNQDGKPDLVLQYGLEYSVPRYKFLRGTKTLFHPSLSWN